MGHFAEDVTGHWWGSKWVNTSDSSLPTVGFPCSFDFVFQGKVGLGRSNVDLPLKGFPLYSWGFVFCFAASMSLLFYLLCIVVSLHYMSTKQFCEHKQIPQMIIFWNYYSWKFYFWLAPITEKYVATDVRLFCYFAWTNKYHQAISRIITYVFMHTRIHMHTL